MLEVLFFLIVGGFAGIGIMVTWFVGWSYWKGRAEITINNKVYKRNI